MRAVQTVAGLISFLFPTVVFASSGNAQVDFPVWSVVFFVSLILSIAIFPLINAEWWGKRFGYVTLALSIPAAILILTKEKMLLVHSLIEYVSFIILLGSLFIISGGIVIRTAARGTPELNCFFLLQGAIFANLIGTTGASMVLIRPMIRANKWRNKVSHIFIFFIFLVSNIGGLLTPLGDPPLFLGFLRGVPFFWTMKLFPIWAFAVAVLLAIFYLVDSRLIKKEDPDAFLKHLDTLPEKKLEIRGRRNFAFLFLVIVSFFIPPVWREMVMILSALGSIYYTPVSLREENTFTYNPIIEVAILFAGIFVTMVPVLTILTLHGSSIGVTEPWHFFWAVGGLSSFLDNAPTYLVFMTTAQSVAVAKGIVASLIVGVPELYLKAVSAGAVFMGANTYVGNGPNFMVKAICNENDIAMPSFFGYMVWSVGILIPIFILVTFVFF